MLTYLCIRHLLTSTAAARSPAAAHTADRPARESARDVGFRASETWLARARLASTPDPTIDSGDDGDGCSKASAGVRRARAEAARCDQGHEHTSFVQHPLDKAPGRRGAPEA
eukprot:6205816-Pleurochrysis_carterae.AAC.3